MYNEFLLLPGWTLELIRGDDDVMNRRGTRMTSTDEVEWRNMNNEIKTTNPVHKHGFRSSVGNYEDQWTAAETITIS